MQSSAHRAPPNSAMRAAVLVMQARRQAASAEAHWPYQPCVQQYSGGCLLRVAVVDARPYSTTGPPHT
jgi:hypothetical protein